MTSFINTPHGSTLAYNQIKGKGTGIVFLSGFGSDMQGKKALFIEKWAKNNNHDFLRFDYSGHGLSSGNLENTCFSDWYKDSEFLIKRLTTGKQTIIGSSMGGWIMLMLIKLIPQKIESIIGLAPAPDFPKVLVWDKMSMIQKKKLAYEKKIMVSNSNGSHDEFSYNLIKDSFKNLVLQDNIIFNGSVSLFHGMQDHDVPYNLSIDIMNRIKGSQNIKLLLDKKAGHRLSEKDELQTVLRLINDILKKV
jgi:pimeloyl-ACP methyl ester carboxylesterase